MNKKYLGMLGLGCGVLLLTVCGGGKTLTCKSDMSEQLAGLGKWDTEVILDYDNDGEKVESTTMKMTIEFTNEDVTDEMIDSFKETLGQSCGSEDAESFDKCEVKKDGRKLTLEAKGPAEANDDLAGITEKTALEEAKKLLEEQGFTCE